MARRRRWLPELLDHSFDPNELLAWLHPERRDHHSMILPRYPVYIPSKGRFENCLTALCMQRDKIPFKLVVEMPERKAYGDRFGNENLLILPFQNRGLIAARNWIKEHATKSGAERHWQLDDNMRQFWRCGVGGRRFICPGGVALRVTEDLADRYSNVAIAGLNYEFFWVGSTRRAPFFVNRHIYSCSLILNSIPNKWRVPLNDDTDMCLQVLADGWCTILMNAFLVQKMQTMKVKGGNTGIYKSEDGRLKMSRQLERLWPGVVTTQRRWKRPAHVIKYQWTHFDTPLKLKPGVKLPAPADDEYGLQLMIDKPIKSASLKKFARQRAKL